ncbi:helicase associated domain-containing protein [Streptomyces sp. NPDC002144]
MSGHPLGVWVADVRRYYREGTLEASRVKELEQLGMVWSVHASAWETGLAVARAYAAVFGHCLPSASTVFDGYPLEVYLKNARAAAKKARENAVRRANGETGISYAGELSTERREALDEIDPGWCPEWDIAWQRRYRLTLAHVKAGGTLPGRAGDVVVQGEDLGAWTVAQRAAWDGLMPAQQYLLQTLGIDPDDKRETAVPAPRSQADRWETNLAAARQFHAREGHLRPARKHVEVVDGAEIKLGSFLDNARRRAAKLSPERRAALEELGMRLGPQQPMT